MEEVTALRYTHIKLLSFVGIFKYFLFKKESTILKYSNEYLKKG